MIMGHDWKTVFKKDTMPKKSLHHPKAGKFIMAVRTNNHKAVFGMICNWPQLVYEYDSVSSNFQQVSVILHLACTI
jgi:hypothetical protein